MSMNSPQAVLKEAQKLESSISGFSLFGGKTSKIEAAAEKYKDAGNAFMTAATGTVKNEGTASLFQQAGQAFEKQASLLQKIEGEGLEIAMAQSEASKMYKNADLLDKAVACMEAAIQVYRSQGQLQRAARQKESIGEWWAGVQQWQSAADAYELAGDWYAADNGAAAANRVKLKFADICALNLNNYDKATTVYETVAAASVDNNLMKYSVKDYYLKAGLCHLASGDMVETTRQLDTYEATDSSFSSMRECKLLRDLSDAMENSDSEAFEDAVYAYDKMSKLSKWHVSLLNVAKAKIVAEEDDFS